MILDPAFGNRLQKAMVSRTIKDQMNNKLFVGSLSLETTENEVRDAFAAHGTVKEANLIMDRMTNRSRGFAFVTMSTDEEAQKAIQALNGKDMGGRALAVSVAKPREERAPARGGGRRDYGGGGGGGRRY
jgi:RNA recognition motif-containing protein